MKLIKTPAGTFNYRKALLKFSRIVVPLLALALGVAIVYDHGRLSASVENNREASKKEKQECPQSKITCKPRKVLDYPGAIRVTTPDFDAYCIEVKNLE